MSESTATEETPAELLRFGWLEDVRILIVDDDACSREALAVALEDQGARVTSVAGVQAAFECFAPAPDLLISDIEMPGLTGFDLIRQVRAADDREGRHLPVIAVTGTGGTGAAERLRAAGFDDYVPKPLDLDYLVERIRLLVV